MLHLRNILVLTLVLLIGLSLPLIAQESRSKDKKSDEGTSRGGLMLFGGLGLPNGAFGKTEGEDAGYAKQGYFGGAEIMFSLAPGVGIVLDGRYMINKLNEEEILKQVGGGSNVSVSLGSFTGILPMAGLRLYLPAPLSIFVDAQAGYMFAKTPEMTYTAPGFSQKVESQNGKGLALGASAGIDIGNTLIVGATYIITKPKFESTSTTGGTSTTTTMEQQMNMIQAWVGIRF